VSCDVLLVLAAVKTNSKLNCVEWDAEPYCFVIFVCEICCQPPAWV